LGGRGIPPYISRLVAYHKLARPSGRRIGDLLSGADNRYAAGEDLRPLVGRWVPDFAVATADRTRRIAGLASDGRPLLLDLTDGGVVAAALSQLRPDADEIPGLRGELARWFGV
jgi:hypothetical protein